MPKKSVRSKPPAKRAVRPGRKSAARPEAKSAPRKSTKRTPIQPAKRTPSQLAPDEPRPAAQSAAAVRRRTAKILLAALARHADETRKRFGALIQSGGDIVSDRIESAHEDAGETLERARAKGEAAPKRTGRKR